MKNQKAKNNNADNSGGAKRKFKKTEAAARKDRLRRGLFVLAVLTVAVIWFNSALPVPISKAQSNMTEKIIENVVSTEVPFFDYVAGNLRKSAHVIEYGILGVIVFLIFAAFPGKRRAEGEKGLCGLSLQRLWNMVTLPLAVAVADESIQMLSGRGPLISDVLIDMLGAVCAMAVCFCVYLAARKIRRSKYPAPKLLQTR